MIMINFSVTKNNLSLNPSLYNWDEKTRTFSSNENELVINFSDVGNVNIKAGSYCRITTGHSSTIKTGDCCTIKTGDSCTIATGDCCTVTTGKECVIVRRDIFGVNQGVIQPEGNQTIKFNNYTGHTIIEETKEDILNQVVNKLKNLSKEDLKRILNS